MMVMMMRRRSIVIISFQTVNSPTLYSSIVITGVTALQVSPHLAHHSKLSDLKLKKIGVPRKKILLQERILLTSM